MKIVGLLVSVLAVSLGAPFGFEYFKALCNFVAPAVSPRESKIK
jgi:hypothetical protein